MSIQDVEEALQEALKEPEKARNKSRYAETIAGYFKDNKSNNEIISVVIRGVDLDRASNFLIILKQYRKMRCRVFGSKLERMS